MSSVGCLLTWQTLGMNYFKTKLKYQMGPTLNEPSTLLAPWVSVIMGPQMEELHTNHSKKRWREERALRLLQEREQTSQHTLSPASPSFPLCSDSSPSFTFFNSGFLWERQSLSDCSSSDMYRWSRPSAACGGEWEAGSQDRQQGAVCTAHGTILIPNPWEGCLIFTAFPQESFLP